MRFTITWREVANLLISTLVLGLLFSFRNLNNLIPYTFIVGLAFIVHELSHKFMAERYECKAEYVLWPQGIFIAFFIAILTNGEFIFAAIGYVSIASYYSTRLGYHYSHLSLEEKGKISASGPVSNLVLGIISAILAPAYPIFNLGIGLNFILAIFNLIPFPPLDGSQVFVWSRVAWVSLMITISAVWGLIYLVGPITAGVIGLIVLIGMIFFTYYKDL